MSNIDVIIDPSLVPFIMAIANDSVNAITTDILMNASNYYAMGHMTEALLFINSLDTCNMSDDICKDTFPIKCITMSALELLNPIAKLIANALIRKLTCDIPIAIIVSYAIGDAIAIVIDNEISALNDTSYIGIDNAIVIASAIANAIDNADCIFDADAIFNADDMDDANMDDANIDNEEVSIVSI